MNLEPIMVSENQQLVLDHFGLEEQNFERLEPLVDFEALARSIREPTKVAVCNVLDGDGKVVTNGEGPVIVHIEVPVENYEEELNKKSMRFLKWYD